MLRPAKAPRTPRNESRDRRERQEHREPSSPWGPSQPEVGRLKSYKQPSGPRCQGGAPAAQRGRTALTPGWRLLRDGDKEAEHEQRTLGTSATWKAPSMGPTKAPRPP